MLENTFEIIVLTSPGVDQVSPLSLAVNATTRVS